MKTVQQINVFKLLAVLVMLVLLLCSCRLMKPKQQDLPAAALSQRGDSDGDGLSDQQETLWKSSQWLINTPLEQEMGIARVELKFKGSIQGRPFQSPLLTLRPSSLKHRTQAYLYRFFGQYPGLLQALEQQQPAGHAEVYELMSSLWDRHLYFEWVLNDELKSFRQFLSHSKSAHTLAVHIFSTPVDPALLPTGKVTGETFQLHELELTIHRQGSSSLPWNAINGMLKLQDQTFPYQYNAQDTATPLQLKTPAALVLLQDVFLPQPEHLSLELTQWRGGQSTQEIKTWEQLEREQPLQPVLSFSLDHQWQALWGSKLALEGKDPEERYQHWYFKTTQKKEGQHSVLLPSQLWFRFPANELTNALAPIKEQLSHYWKAPFPLTGTHFLSTLKSQPANLPFALHPGMAGLQLFYQGLRYQHQVVEVKGEIPIKVRFDGTVTYPTENCYGIAPGDPLLSDSKMTDIELLNHLPWIGVTAEQHYPIFSSSVASTPIAVAPEGPALQEFKERGRRELPGQQFLIHFPLEIGKISSAVIELLGQGKTGEQNLFYPYAKEQHQKFCASRQAKVKQLQQVGEILPYFAWKYWEVKPIYWK